MNKNSQNFVILGKKNNFENFVLQKVLLTIESLCPTSEDVNLLCADVFFSGKFLVGQAQYWQPFPFGHYGYVLPDILCSGDGSISCRSLFLKQNTRFSKFFQIRYSIPTSIKESSELLSKLTCMKTFWTKNTSIFMNSLYYNYKCFFRPENAWNRSNTTVFW